MMCRVLGVSASGFHAWRKRPPSRRARENEALSRRIAEIHKQSRGTYGGRRVHAALRAEGRAVSRQRMERLMRALGLQGVHRRRPRGTTRAARNAQPVPDRVERRFEACEPNRLWVADITYVTTQEGFLYLAMVLDVFSRKVVGWAMGARQTAALARSALDMALQARAAQGVIFHSDHGSQFTALVFTSRCEQAGVLQSMGGRRQLLRQRHGREFLRHRRMRAAAPHPLRHPPGSRHRDLPLPGGLLQPATAAFRARLPLANEFERAWEAAQPAPA